MVFVQEKVISGIRASAGPDRLLIDEGLARTTGGDGFWGYEKYAQKH